MAEEKKEVGRPVVEKAQRGVNKAGLEDIKIMPELMDNIYHKAARVIEHNLINKGDVKIDPQAPIPNRLVEDIDKARQELLRAVTGPLPQETYENRTTKPTYKHQFDARAQYDITNEGNEILPNGEKVSPNRTEEKAKSEPDGIEDPDEVRSEVLGKNSTKVTIEGVEKDEDVEVR